MALETTTIIPVQNQQDDDDNNRELLVNDDNTDDDEALLASYINENYISSYLCYDDEKNYLTFDFSFQYDLFLNLVPLGHTSRPYIVKTFVNALINHKLSNEFERINLSNSAIGNDVIVHLYEKIKTSTSSSSLSRSDGCDDDDGSTHQRHHDSNDKCCIFPKLKIINLESNYLSEVGIIALFKCISIIKNLEIIKLENQQNARTTRHSHNTSTQTENEICKVLSKHYNIIQLGLTIHNITLSNEINKYISRNIELRRHSRRRFCQQEQEHHQKQQEKDKAVVCSSSSHNSDNNNHNPVDNDSASSSGNDIIVSADKKPVLLSSSPVKSKTTARIVYQKEKEEEETIAAAAVKTSNTTTTFEPSYQDTPSLLCCFC